MSRTYDYLIVGAGITGCILADQLSNRGSVLLIDKNNHIGGTCYTYKDHGIMVHKYGPHIYRTNNAENMLYLERFTIFNNFINEPIANYYGKLYNLPFNMNTFNKVWPDVITPADAKAKIESEIKSSYKDLSNITNLEDKAISLVGTTLYEILIKGYTEKQWGQPCDTLPASIISVLPLRFTYNNNYFSAKYQGIPIDGYTKMMENMIDHSAIDLELNKTITSIEDDIFKKAGIVIYTGRLDHLFNYSLGALPYRGAVFTEQFINNCNNYQGVAVMNFTGKDVSYLRRTEHKHFTFGDNYNYTILSTESSCDATYDIEHDHYPIDNSDNRALQEKYKKMLPNNFLTCGVAGDYRPYTMDDSIEAVRKLLPKLGLKFN